MINTYLEEQFKTYFRFNTTTEQETAIQRLISFLLSKESEEAFILRGYAGKIGRAHV